MRNPTLLDRQLELLRYLTNTDLVFGGKAGLSRAANDPSLRGMSLPLLRLEAEMSFSKRMGKIAKPLDRTFAYLGHHRTRIFREFADAFPPKTFKRYDEALAFHQFLIERWKLKSAVPAFLPDIARLEIVMSRIRAQRASSVEGPPPDGDFVRLSESAEVIRLEFDIRPIFETKDIITDVPRVENHILVAQMIRGRGPRIVPIVPTIAKLLSSLTTWTPLTDVVAQATESADDAPGVISGLIRGGAIETSQTMTRSPGANGLSSGKQGNPATQSP
jgi:hypothetical protein